MDKVLSLFEQLDHDLEVQFKYADYSLQKVSLAKLAESNVKAHDYLKSFLGYNHDDS